MRELIRHILREHTREIGEGAPKVTFDQFLKRAHDVHGDKYNYDESSFKGMTKNMKIICPIHGEFEQTPKSHTVQKSQCPKCSGTYKNTKEDFINLSKEKFGDRYDYSLVDYEKTEKPVKLICPIHGEFEQTPYHHLLSKTGCPFCGGTARQSTEIYVKKSKQIYGDKYDYSQIVYKNNRTPITIKCNKHGYFQRNPREFLRGVECDECMVEKKTSDFINKAEKVHKGKYTYDKTNYIHSQDEVIIKCPEHGYFPQIAVNHLMGQACPTCNESKGERFIANFLGKQNINFERQYKFTDCTNQRPGRGCRKLPFDFFIPKLNTCIEYDGRQHFESSAFFKGEEALEKQKFTDELKNQYCKKNGIKLIRIPYTMKKEEIEPYILKELGIK
jgi:hypothetical protein